MKPQMSTKTMKTYRNYRKSRNRKNNNTNLNGKHLDINNHRNNLNNNNNFCNDNNPNNNFNDQKQNVTQQKTKEETVKPYPLPQLIHLNIDELKILLKKHNFNTKGNKKELMKRLMNPYKAIIKMKMQIHMERVQGYETFDHTQYVYRKGTIKHVSEL